VGGRAGCPGAVHAVDEEVHQAHRVAAVLRPQQEARLALTVQGSRQPTLGSSTFAWRLWPPPREQVCHSIVGLGHHRRAVLHPTTTADLVCNGGEELDHDVLHRIRSLITSPFNDGVSTGQRLTVSSTVSLRTERVSADPAFAAI
jgi:hypothetical protein